MKKAIFIISASVVAMMSFVGCTGLDAGPGTSATTAPTATPASTGSGN